MVLVNTSIGMSGGVSGCSIQLIRDPRFQLALRPAGELAKPLESVRHAERQIDGSRVCHVFNTTRFAGAKKARSGNQPERVRIYELLRPAASADRIAFALS